METLIYKSMQHQLWNAVLYTQRQRVTSKHCTEIHIQVNIMQILGIHTSTVYESCPTKFTNTALREVHNYSFVLNSSSSHSRFVLVTPDCFSKQVLGRSFVTTYTKSIPFFLWSSSPSSMPCFVEASMRTNRAAFSRWRSFSNNVFSSFSTMALESASRGPIT